MELLVLAGDGIGPEITKATLTVLRALDERFGLALRVREDLVGHESLEHYGTTVRPELLELARAADGLVLGPAATFDFKDPSRGEINPSAYFRSNLELFANIRPSRTYDGYTGPVGEFDLVIVRENSEGFYADRNMARGNADLLVTEDVAIAIRKITRAASERITRVACELALARRRRLTIVHKANVLSVSDGLFLETSQSVAAEYPDLEVNEVIVDAMAALLVREPRRFDVVVTTNMFGDILSDLAAELSGSLGLGGSLNAGERYAMAQAAHGSAPDIAGQDVANPLSLIISVGLLLDWHGRRHADSAFTSAAAALFAAIADAVRDREVTKDIGGALGTTATGAGLARQLELG